MKRLQNFITIPAERKNSITLILLALGLGFAAQVILLLSVADEATYWRISAWFSELGNNTSPVLGLGLYTLAGILLILGVRQGQVAPPPAFEISTQTRPALPPRFGFWMTSLGLAGLSSIYAYRQIKDVEQSYGPALIWILSLALFTYSVLRQAGWQPPSLRSSRDWVLNRRYELLRILLLIILALFMRTIDLELHPYSMVNDEGEMGKGGLCLLRGECQNIFAIAWASQPLVAYLPYSLSIAIFGHQAAFPVRLVSALTGVLSVLFTYLFVRETFGQKTAWVAGVLLATFPFHLHFSRIGVDNIVDSLSSSLLLWLLFRGARKGSVGYFLAAGIVAGLCFYTYPGSRLSAALVAGLLGLIILARRGFLRAQLGNLVIFALAAVLTAAPIYGTYQAAKGEFNARMGLVGIFQSGALEAEMRADQLSAAQVLLREFFKSSLPFIATSGPLNFFNTPRAYLSPLAAILLMFGLALAFWRIRDLRYFTLLAWFFASIVVGSTLTAGAPSNQRMLGSSPAAAILAAMALVTIAQVLQNGSGFLRRITPALLLVVLLFNGYQDINYYFGDYRQGHFFEDASNEMTYESRTLIASMTGKGRLYLIGEPVAYVVFGNFNFLTPDVPKANFNEITREAIAALPKDQDALFLAIPYREPDLLKIAEWLPGGEWIAENRRYQPEEPLFFAYKVSQEQLQSFQP